MPDRLIDGSLASALPVELEGVEEPAMLTRVRVVLPADRRGTTSASCLETGGWRERPRGPSVERIGVRSETVTFEEDSGRGIFGCDDSPGPREENRRWCGGAYGLLYDGRLRDPRLDIGGCRTDDDEPIAFVWVYAGSDARYVAVRQPDFTEVYEIAGGLPVRIATTTGFMTDPLGAAFEFSEHDPTGKLLRRRHVDAVPAG